MYCPAHFQEDRVEVLLDLIARHPLATIVANDGAGLVADHVPLLHEAVADGPGRLVGHVARANPLWQAPPEREHLIVFQGPSAYVSPNWYATKHDGGRVVPTWNYAVVHVHATLTVIEAPERILPILEKLTDTHESGLATPWRAADAPADFTQRLLGSIVGIELAITRMQGKWKVSQNQPASNREGVAAGLDTLGSDASQVMASLVRTGGLERP